MDLDAPLSTGNRSLKMYAKRLTKLNLYTFRDLLYHIPSRYEDYSLVSKIGELQEGEKVTVKGQVIDAKTTYTRSRKTLQKVTLKDETGEITLHWFNQPYIVKNLTIGDTLSVSGNVGLFSKKISMIAPEFEIVREGDLIHTGRVVPIYPETAGVSSKWLRRQIILVLTDALPKIEDCLPASIQNSNNLLPLTEAIQTIHFPSRIEDTVPARRRLAFDEIFLIQLTALERKKKWKLQKNGYPMKLSENAKAEFLKSLPFTLTPSQLTAIEDIIENMKLSIPMNRLLQGDVGSGKTVIAALASYIAYKNGFQSAIMAPTEILAQQHFATLKSFLEPFGIEIGLVTGSVKLEKDKTLDVIVGTHALVAKAVNFERLGFIGIDEQQRFGVEQRGVLRDKGTNPHLLTMTATPIPRTMALTLYGELDSSYLTDMPKGRKSIKTWIVADEKRDGAYNWIRKQIKETDSQVFIICPFIKNSENMQTVKAASSEFERLKTEVFPDLRLGLLHGKLKAKEKDTILTSFRNKNYDILVATPVVEVGIDIPNATIMLIEGSERFGLAQLHQLRGRVGRGDKQSYCLLFTTGESQTSTKRLKAMETMSQGASLAEFDLNLRGPGELYGSQQSGTRMLKIASFSDIKLLSTAKQAATEFFPELEQYPTLEKMVVTKSGDNVVPD